MPVSVVVGGQFGSEGKGKVACELARLKGSRIAVRVGGSNSGHTVIDQNGKERKFRSLPTASILPDTISVIAAGSYVDVDVLLKEIYEGSFGPERVIIDPRATIITDAMKGAEKSSNLRQSIGSTLSGTGAAVHARACRDGSAVFAKDIGILKPYIRDASLFLRGALEKDERVIVEGTQGFGLSVLHSNHYPFVTSRDTSAASFVSEAGLSPMDVDEIYMVLRAFPIRVAGNSGELPNEINWQTITSESGYDELLEERTTVTDKVRRVARFDPKIVQEAIGVNNPTHIVLNHVDYIDASCRKTHRASLEATSFIKAVERKIDQSVDYIGFGPATMVPNDLSGVAFASA